MSSRPVIEELPSSSDDESLDFDSAEDLSGDSDDEIKRHDPLADFEKVEASAAAQSREAAVEGAPVDFTNPIDLTEPKEEVLEVEELPEEEMKKVRVQFQTKMVPFWRPMRRYDIQCSFLT